MVTPQVGSDLLLYNSSHAMATIMLALTLWTLWEEPSRHGWKATCSR